MADTLLTDTFFEQFDLHPLLQQGIAHCGFTRCTPIQALTLPVALSGRDVAGQAQTGTGKTAAFLVTTFNRLLTGTAKPARRPEDPRALVIAPTRELAIQIDKDARSIGSDLGLRIALIYGGVDYERQRQRLKDGCDIIIATPGRLIDYYKQHLFTLNAVEVMVVDEADRMFDLGFIKDIYFLFRRLPPREERQSLLFSATLSHRVLELAYEHMNEPEKMVVESEHITADRVRQRVYYPAREEKIPLLLNLLERSGTERCIVFVNTRAAVERVSDRLSRHGFRVAALSGDVPQKKRERLLGRFQSGEVEVLVATDVAARGLHIPNVSHVYNYDLPQDAEDYVHRIGRTARLGADGDAVSFACDRYAMGLPDIETFIGQKIPMVPITEDLLVPPPPRARTQPVPVSKQMSGEGGAQQAQTLNPARRHRSRKSRSKPPVSKSSGSLAGTPPVTDAAATASGTVQPGVALTNNKEPQGSSANRSNRDVAAHSRRGRRGRGRGRGVKSVVTDSQVSMAHHDSGNGASPDPQRPSGEDSLDRRKNADSTAVAHPFKGSAGHRRPGFLRRLGSLFRKR